MSDKDNSLKSVGERIRAGLNKVNEQAKAKAEGKQHQKRSHEDDSEMADVPEHPNQTEAPLTAVDDDLEDGLIIEGEAQPTKAKRKGMSTKQWLILMCAVGLGGVWAIKNQGHAPSPAQVTQAESSATKASTDTQNMATGQSNDPAFDFGKAPESEAPIAIASSNSDSSFGDDKAAVKSQDPANAPIGTDLITADLNDQFSGSASEPTKTLDPFTGEVKTATPAAFTSQDALTQPGGAPKPAKAQPTKSLQAGSATSDLGLAGGDTDSPFPVGASNSTELSGTKNQNPDSKAGVLQDQGAKADVAALKAKIAEKDGRIGTLESEVSKLTADLAAAKLKQDASKPHQGTTKAVASKVAQNKAVQPIHTAQRSPSTHRTATASKAVARPQICVTAVAQAARNCTTCVPHAFITNRGSETMVGQGDFIDGMRVNIVGDRLDLQNADGVVVHKFWSSPNGCAAG